jgi:hypothetical protein
MNTRPTGRPAPPSDLSWVSAPMGNGDGPIGARKRKGRGFASVGVASYCKGAHRPTRAPILRAGNSDRKVVGNSRGQDGRLDGASFRGRALPSNRSLARNGINALRHDVMSSSPALSHETLKARQTRTVTKRIMAKRRSTLTTEMPDEAWMELGGSRTRRFGGMCVGLSSPLKYLP